MKSRKIPVSATEPFLVIFRIPLQFEVQTMKKSIFIQSHLNEKTLNFMLFIIKITKCLITFSTTLKRIGFKLIDMLQRY